MLGIIPPEDPSKTLTAPGVLRALYIIRVLVVYHSVQLRD